MSQSSNLIYELKGLKKTYNKQTVLNIGRLQFHRGTIYGIVGPVGSGKSTLLNIMACLDKQSDGLIQYDNTSFETGWFGKLKTHSEIKLTCLEKKIKGVKVENLFSGKSEEQILSKYFSGGTWNKLLNRNIRDLSKGETACLNMALAVESDPRVLLIDDYGIYFDKDMETIFRKRLKRMNKDLGTTILLSAPHDQNLKFIASVLIYLDNGHIAKVRSGAGRGGGIKKDDSSSKSKKYGNKKNYRRQRSQRQLR